MAAEVPTRKSGARPHGGVAAGRSAPPWLYLLRTLDPNILAMYFTRGLRCSRRVERPGVPTPLGLLG